MEDVATFEAWQRNPEFVLQFYNERRKAGMEAKPNAGHKVLADLQKQFDVQIITQNVDNLHEQAGSKKVLHLHGEMFKSRSTRNPDLVYEMTGWELNIGDRCELGSQLRPHIVWFGEAVPMIEPALELSADADIFVVVGTSLVVYPAASLVYYVAPRVPVFVVDPQIPDVETRPTWTFIAEKATVGMEMLKQKLLAEYL